MAELKTKETGASVATFLAAIGDDRRRQDCIEIARLMERATKAQPRMWGSGVVGFGNRHYKYASGREGDWFVLGFSPRKGDITLYLATGLDSFEHQLATLGRHKAGKSCLYVKQLADVDVKVLKAILAASAKAARSGSAA